MKFCINEASTMPTDFATDVRAYSAAGFKGIELWLAKVDKYLESGTLAGAARLLQDHGLVAAGSCAAGLPLVTRDDWDKAVAELKRKLELCQALGAPRIVVTAARPPEGAAYDYDLAVDNLRQAAEIAAPYGVTLALEFIKGHAVVGAVSTAALLVAKANHPNLGILFDTFHYFAGVSKASDLALIPQGKVAFVHVNDCLDLPRERLTDAERTYIGRGPIPTKQLVEAVRAKGYDGWLSFEIFSRAVWAEDPFQVAVQIKRNLEEALG